MLNISTNTFYLILQWTLMFEPLVAILTIVCRVIS